MYIGYTPPQGTFTITGAGATIVNDVAGLTDGLPDQATRFTFVTGAQTTASAVKIQCNFAAASQINRGGIFSTSLPAGTLIKILGKRPADAGYTYDLGGNSQSQRVVTRDDKKNVCIWQFDDGIDAVSAYEITIYNDVNGSAAIAAGAYFDIGEIVVAPHFYIEIDTGWKFGLAKADSTRSTHTNQPWPRLYARGRVLTCASSVIPFALAKGSPASGLNLDQLEFEIGDSQVCIVTILTKGAGGSLDAGLLQQTTFLAICETFGEREMGAGRFSTMAWQFNEIPG